MVLVSCYLYLVHVWQAWQDAANGIGVLLFILGACVVSTAG